MKRRHVLKLLGGAGTLLAISPGLLLGASSPHDLAVQGQELLTAGQLDKALEVLLEARRLDPRNDRVRALLGRLWFQRGDARRALEEFRLAVRLNPEDTLSRIMSLPVFATPAGAGAWTLQVVVTPGGSRDVLAGLAEDRLRVRLRAKAVEGAANAALTTFLAAVFGVRPRQVRLVAGERSRKKRIRIETESEPDWSAVAGMGCDENRQQGVVAMAPAIFNEAGNASLVSIADRVRFGPCPGRKPAGPADGKRLGRQG